MVRPMLGLSVRANQKWPWHMFRQLGADTAGLDRYPRGYLPRRETLPLLCTGGPLWDPADDGWGGGAAAADGAPSLAPSPRPHTVVGNGGPPPALCGRAGPGLLAQGKAHRAPLDRVPGALQLLVAEVGLVGPLDLGLERAPLLVPGALLEGQRRMGSGRQGHGHRPPCLGDPRETASEPVDHKLRVRAGIQLLLTNGRQYHTRMCSNTTCMVRTSGVLHMHCTRQKTTSRLLQSSSPQHKP